MKFINRRDTFVLAAMVLVGFTIEMSLGLFLLPLLQIPLVGGLASALIDAMVVCLALFLVPRSGAGIFYAVLLLALSIPTPSFGPPGMYKLFIGLILGLTVEAPLLLSRRPVSYIIATALGFGASIPATYVAWRLADLPAASALPPNMWWMIPTYTILGGIGAILGYQLYRTRLQSLTLITRIREGS